MLNVRRVDIGKLIGSDLAPEAMDFVGHGDFNVVRERPVYRQPRKEAAATITYVALAGAAGASADTVYLPDSFKGLPVVNENGDVIPQSQIVYQGQASAQPVQYVDVLGLSKDAATTTTTASAPNATSFTITSDLAPSQSGFSPLGGGGGGYGPLNGGGNIPWLHTVYIAPDFSNLPYITSNWSQNDSTAFNWMDGAVTYQGGSDVPIHNTLLFYDLADRQMVGWFEITENGWYDQRFGGYGMFGDDLGLPGDQGWTHNDYVGVLMKSTDGKFFSGSFADNPRFNASEEYIGTHNISIGNEIQIVPEPSTGLLMGAGLLAAMLWTRFRYGSRHKED